MMKVDEPGIETVDMDEFTNSCVFDERANTHSTVFRNSGCVVAGFMTKCNESKQSKRRSRRKQTKQKTKESEKTHIQNTEVFSIKIEPSPMNQLDGDSGIKFQTD